VTTEFPRDASRAPADATPVLSIVIPVFNEGANVDLLVGRLVPVLDRIVPTWEIVFIDDGSRDDTLARI
jgi:glycosyltransferase involved in cell wall biosynthesis